MALWQRLKNMLLVAAFTVAQFQLAACSNYNPANFKRGRSGVLRLVQITDPVKLGESPHWDEKQQALFFVNGQEGAIHKYVLATNVHTKATLSKGENIGFIVPVEGTTDKFIVGFKRKFVIIKWDGQEGSQVKVVRVLGEVDQHAPTNYINDGKADPRGRIFAGTLCTTNIKNEHQKKNGSLYRIDMAKGGRVERIASGIGISNGLAWDLKEKAFYYSDSLEKRVRRYDYDVETGDISNLTYIFDLSRYNLSGIADGMTIDTDGNLWMANYDGSRVLKVDPRTKKLLKCIHMPVDKVTSVTFGGPNLDKLFITTGGKIKGNKLRGSTFMAIGMKAKGHINVNFRM